MTYAAEYNEVVARLLYDSLCLFVRLSHRVLLSSVEQRKTACSLSVDFGGENRSVQRSRWSGGLALVVVWSDCCVGDEKTRGSWVEGRQRGGRVRERREGEDEEGGRGATFI